ncbi:DUF3500 domain-containing protein [Botrimarina sp.]|uniref:DUF3500 domain-containing protein n=1 Tax=Botrimarina sp. TaxID=2795802 RepID=UPI0032EF0655
MSLSANRRKFLAASAAGAGLALLPGSGKVWATPAAGSSASRPESLVKLLYESLTPGQREKICFAWDHTDDRTGGAPLRRHVSANWDITDEYVVDDFYSGEQKELIRAIYEGTYNPEWVERVDRQLDDDAGGYGEQNSIAIFGEPGTGKFEFVMTGRHMTVRCDGNTTPHFAFGGPIFYGHAAEAFDEEAHHPGNVYWPQAVAANELYQMLDGEQQQAALVRDGMPGERRINFGALQHKQGIPVAQLSADQQEHLRGVLSKLVEPYRQTDRDEAFECLVGQQADGKTGLAACHLAYYQEGDIGGDGVWDNWRVEGPSFVWHYRGAPHVHVWVNVADDPAAQITTG